MAARAIDPDEADSRPVVAVFRSPVFNASETFVPAQAAALSRYRPLIVGLERKGGIPPALADRVTIVDSAGERLALKLLGRGDALAARLRPHQPVLIHAHFGPDGLLALPVARRLGVSLVTTLHGYDASRSQSALLGSGRLSWMRYALLRRRLQREGDLFIAVSEALRRQALARGFPAERTITHHIGVDLARFPAGGGGSGAILHVGRLVEKKGTHLLLQAFARARPLIEGARLVIVGDGPRRGALERLAAELALGESVAFLGAQPPEVVGEWMRRAELLAAPSVTAADGDAEGLPVVIFEAAASALPVLGSTHSGIPEGIVDGETGFVVPEGDVGALAERLVAMLGTGGRAGAMRPAARALAERKFDLARQAARLEALYDSVRENRTRLR